MRKGYRVLKKAGKRVKSFDGDKGYDSEENHRLVVEVLGAEDRMKLKNRDVPVSRTSGRYRKKAKKRIKRLRANYRAKTLRSRTRPSSRSRKGFAPAQSSGA